MEQTENETYFSSVDDLVWWSAGLNSATPEIRYIVLKQIRSSVLKNSTKQVIETYDLLLQKAKSETDPQTISNMTVETLYRMWRNNRTGVLIGLGSILFCLSMGTYNFVRMLVNDF